MSYDLKITMSNGIVHCSTFQSLEELQAYDLAIYGDEFKTITIPEETIIEVPEQVIHHPEQLDEHGNLMSEAYDQIIPAVTRIVPAYEVQVANYTKEIIENKEKDIKEAIFMLESQITPRRVREAMLSGDFSFIQEINSQIEALRQQL